MLYFVYCSGIVEVEDIAKFCKLRNWLLERFMCAPICRAYISLCSSRHINSESDTANGIFWEFLSKTD